MYIYATFDRPAELSAAAERVGRVTRGRLRFVADDIQYFAYHLNGKGAQHDTYDFAAVQRWPDAVRAIPGVDLEMLMAAQRSVAAADPDPQLES